jgi:hypothetical protein
MPFSLTWLADTLRAVNLPVQEVHGWKNRGVGGDVTSAKGVVCHHTAGPLAGNAPSLSTVIHGRSDLSGPLAQLLLARDGTYYVVAAGRAHHAGPGKWQDVTNGNSHFIGIEAENTGLIKGPKADPWPMMQMNAYRWGVAAILRKIGAGASMCCGHGEYALPKGRKDDPSFDMDQFRLDVDACMTILGVGTVDHPLQETPATTFPTQQYVYGRYIV